MKKPTNQLEEWEQIERYWLGRLSATEQADFDELMNADKRLADEANSLRLGLQLLEEARLGANARRVLQQLRGQHHRDRQYRLRWGALAGGLMAACVAFVLFLAYAPISLPKQESDSGILREFRSQYQTDSTNQLSWRQKQTFDRFFEGQVFLNEGQPQLAAGRFEKVLSYRELRPYFREAAQWHLLICYAKMGRVEKTDQLYGQFSQAQEYEIDRLERWKIWWHLRRLSLMRRT